MSIFKRKNESTDIDNLKSENEKLKREINSLKNKMLSINKCLDSTPEDCTRGIWCETCVFSEPYYITNGITFSDSYSIIYLCGKGTSCKHFAQRTDILKGEKDGK